jgi:quercetin dioxygenase-like cupin family protein
MALATFIGGSVFFKVGKCELLKKLFTTCHNSGFSSVLVGECRKFVSGIFTKSKPKECIMRRSLLLVAFGMIVGFGVAGMTFAHLHEEDGESVKVLSAIEIKEKLDGKVASATFVEVTIKPGEVGLAHRHPGPGFVYVIEGQYELGIDDQPTKIYKAGETFYEPTGCLHRVSKNPSAKGITRLMAVVLHPRDAKEVAIPEPKGE